MPNTPVGLMENVTVSDTLERAGVYTMVPIGVVWLKVTDAGNVVICGPFPGKKNGVYTV